MIIAKKIEVGCVNMPKVEEFSHDDEKDLLRFFSLQAAILLILLYALFFWAGLYFLREDIFKHYFNPSRHMIVEQNPNTFEIMAWKDALGNIYTPEDIQVKLFPFAIMLLGVMEAAFFAGIYYLLKWHYTARIFFIRDIYRTGTRGEQGS